MQLASGAWEDCCALFRHDPRDAGRDDKFKIEGLRVGLFPHQALAIFWALKSWSEEGDTLFLADEMGVGKTLEFLGLWAVHRHLKFAWDAVQKARASDDPLENQKHLPAEGQEAQSRCPTNP